MITRTKTRLMSPTALLALGILDEPHSVYVRDNKGLHPVQVKETRLATR